LSINYQSDFEECQTSLAGARYDRNKPHGGRYSRWGYNEGSVRIADEKIGIKVPRLIDHQDDSTFNVPEYTSMQDNRAGEERIMKGMLKGFKHSELSRSNRFGRRSFWHE
jgi:hypothetical protein